MKDGSWSLVGDPREVPKIVGKPSFDATRTIWTVPIRLEPESSYRFGLHAPQFRGFQSAKGVPLEPVSVRFRTGRAREKPSSAG